jgi:hypothetical protein
LENEEKEIDKNIYNILNKQNIEKQQYPMLQTVVLNVISLLQRWTMTWLYRGL